MSGETDGNKRFQAENHETSKKTNSMFYHVVLPAETLTSNVAVLLLRGLDPTVGSHVELQEDHQNLPRACSRQASDTRGLRAHQPVVPAPSYLGQEKTGITEIASLRSASAPLIIHTSTASTDVTKPPGILPASTRSAKVQADKGEATVQDLLLYHGLFDPHSNSPHEFISPTRDSNVVGFMKRANLNHQQPWFLGANLNHSWGPLDWLFSM